MVKQRSNSGQRRSKVGQIVVKRWSHGSQTLVRRWSNAGPLVVEPWSNGCQTVVERRSNSSHMLVKRWSNGGQTVVKRWSKGGQTAVKCWSNTGQTLVNQRSNSGLIARVRLGVSTLTGSIQRSRGGGSGGGGARCCASGLSLASCQGQTRLGYPDQAAGEVQGKTDRRRGDGRQWTDARIQGGGQGEETGLGRCGWTAARPLPSREGAREGGREGGRE